MLMYALSANGVHLACMYMHTCAQPSLPLSLCRRWYTRGVINIKSVVFILFPPFIVFRCAMQLNSHGCTEVTVGQPPPGVQPTLAAPPPETMKQ